ncbi:MAG: hypothetical protein H6812_11375 [Phycisphaeraceae bacterium]|nr:hypothetical protein [Phycisphaerales bacterium]MCB9843843.1 hypothetical protein [Phycisphaeraceae bacterium]
MLRKALLLIAGFMMLEGAGCAISDGSRAKTFSESEPVTIVHDGLEVDDGGIKSGLRAFVALATYGSQTLCTGQDVEFEQYLPPSAVGRGISFKVVVECPLASPPVVLNTTPNISRLIALDGADLRKYRQTDENGTTIHGIDPKTGFWASHAAVLSHQLLVGYEELPSQVEGIRSIEGWIDAYVASRYDTIEIPLTDVEKVIDLGDSSIIIQSLKRTRGVQCDYVIAIDFKQGQYDSSGMRLAPRVLPINIITPAGVLLITESGSVQESQTPTGLILTTRTRLSNLQDGEIPEGSFFRIHLIREVRHYRLPFRAGNIRF